MPSAATAPAAVRALPTWQTPNSHVALFRLVIARRPRPHRPWIYRARVLPPAPTWNLFSTSARTAVVTPRDPSSPSPSPTSPPPPSNEPPPVPPIGDHEKGSSIDTPVTQKPYYVTTPIFYVNASPHVGHLHSMVLADVVYRWNAWKRGQHIHAPSEGAAASAGGGGGGGFAIGAPNSTATGVDEVHALLATGTDEHGLKVQQAARNQGMDPQRLCDTVSGRFRDLAAAAGLAPHTFIRTTEARHRLAVHHMWTNLARRGLIYRGTHEGWYAEGDEAFYTPGQVRRADADEVKPGERDVMVAVETGTRVEWSSEENYKFRLSQMREPLLKWLKENPQAILPSMRHEQVLAEVESGLSDLSVSRPSSRLQWGLRVPNDEAHTIYVWVDALTNYLTVAGYPWSGRGEAAHGGGSTVPAWRASAWPADVHIVGKDILRFHAIYWPAMLLGAGLPLPRHVVAHGHWTMNRHKMSKSRGNVADPFEALRRFGTDELRWYLMRVGGGLAGDSDYAPTTLAEYHRKYLQGQLGNLVSRLLAPKLLERLAEAGSGSGAGAGGGHGGDGHETAVYIPRPGDVDVEEMALAHKLTNLAATVDGHMRVFELSKALEAVHDAVGEANRLVQAYEPWSSRCEADRRRRCVYWAYESVRLASLLLAAAWMPARRGAAALDALEVPREERTWACAQSMRDVARLPRRREKLAPLFPRLVDETMGV